MESRIIDLETKFAFQEDLLKQLNEALTQQQALIDQLVKDNERLKRFVDSEKDSGIKDISLEVPPPHY